MIGDEFSSQFYFRDEEDSELSDEEQKQKWPENRQSTHENEYIKRGKKLFVEIQKPFLNLFWLIFLPFFFCDKKVFFLFCITVI